MTDRLTEQPEDVDAQCHCDRCERRTQQTYLMRHWCSNCNSEFTARHRFGDKAKAACPWCGAHWVNTRAKERVPQ